MTRYRVFLSSYDIDTDSKNSISQQKSKQTTPTTTKNKNKKTRVFFTTWLGVMCFFRDNVKLFMKESAGFTHDEPKARKGMQA